MPPLPKLLGTGLPLAVLLAVAGAALLALGTHLQQRRAAALSPTGSSTPPALGLLLASPLWLLGGALIGLETVANIVALGLAPVALIQPLGTLSLVVAVLLTAASTRTRPSGAVLGAVLLVIGSVSVFVTVAGRHMDSAPAPGPGVVLLALGLLALSGLGMVVARSRTGHAARVAVAAVLFGCVASGAHVVASRLLTGEGLDPVTWTVLAGLAPASGAGIWLVQTAYASGSAASVLAGLTVIDPLTAIAVGGLVLGEARPVSTAAALLLLVSAVGALWGVRVLVRHRPGTPAPACSPAQRGSADTMEGARAEGVPAPS